LSLPPLRRDLSSPVISGISGPSTLIFRSSSSLRIEGAHLSSFRRVGLCLILFGCAPTAEIASNKTADYSGRPRKLFVLEVIDTYKFGGPDLLHAFQKHLDHQLRECGVEATHFSREPPVAGSAPLSPTNPDVLATRAAIASARPDALLSIGEKSYRATNGDLTEAQYLLRLKDLQSGSEVWTATVTLAPHRGTLSAGEELAGDVVSRLKQDGILRSCGTGASVAAAVSAPSVAATDQPAAPAANETIFQREGKTYPTAAAMLEAERRDYAATVDALRKEPKPLKGRALIVLPTSEALIRLKSAGAHVVAGFGLGDKEAIALLVGLSRVTLDSSADALLKTGLFERATVVEQGDTLAPPMGAANYLVWYRIPHEGTAADGQWMVRAARGQPTPVEMPGKGVKLGTSDYYDEFVENVRDALTKASATG
jgi:hypothetical protein